MARKKNLREQAPVEVNIESLSLEGRGVAHVDGKTWFVDGALAGERVMAQPVKTQRNFNDAVAVEVIQASPERVAPRCAHFGVCGGCSLQHLRGETQIQFKQEGLLQNLQRIGRVSWRSVMPPLTAEPWGYRRRARLGVKFVEKKGRVLIGFREKHSHFLADITQCPVLAAGVGDRLPQLAALIESLSVKQAVPQIEVSCADNQTALVLRHLQPLTDDDIAKLVAFENETGYRFLLQPGDLKSIHPLSPQTAQPLYYELPDFNVRLEHLPADFVQVNGAINRKMVALALQWLAPKSNETVMDLFCGVGNFSLPLARVSQHVIAVEGEAGLVQRARHNASINGITNVEFHNADLAKDTAIYPWANRTIDKLLLDPARAGAFEVLPHLKKWQPKKIVYVSCNPATLARDADVIVNQFGYKFEICGVMDMFPHTAHVESIALFSR